MNVNYRANKVGIQEGIIKALTHFESANLWIRIKVLEPPSNITFLNYPPYFQTAPELLTVYLKKNSYFNTYF